MFLSMGLDGRFKVALRKESVDRNTMRRDFKALGLLVALRKESVDRNSIGLASFRAYIVALRKESVDRNYIIKITKSGGLRSLSARRAWIEILAYPDMIICTNGRSPQGERG